MSETLEGKDNRPEFVKNFRCHCGSDKCGAIFQRTPHPLDPRTMITVIQFYFCLNCWAMYMNPDAIRKGEEGNA